MAQPLLNSSEAKRCRRGCFNGDTLAASSPGELGFTLVELLVVTVLLAIMSAILYSTINGIIQARTLVDEERQSARVAQYVLERLTREMMSRALVTLSSTEDDEQSRSSATATKATVFDGTNKNEGRSDADKIRFVSSGAAQAAIGGVPNYGLVEVEYQLAQPQGRDIRTRASDGLDNLLLVRTERPADVRNKDLLKKRTISVILAEDVVGLNFRYLKEGKWLEEWKNQGSRIPEAVEISLRLRGAEQRVETYRTAVMISRPLNTAR